MTANNLPNSHNYDIESSVSNSQQANRSKSRSLSANDEEGFSGHQNSFTDYQSYKKTAANVTNSPNNYTSNIASNDTDFDDSSNHSVSCGYKKAANLTANELHSELSKTIVPTVSNDDSTHSFINSNESVSLSTATFKKISHKKEAALEGTKFNAKVSERVFMNSLIKHTIIALAIIIPLAAFSTYAATPATPMGPMDSDKATATIDIEPSKIIHKSATMPTTVDSVDLNSYAGTWYEIGRLPMYFQRNCAGDVTATYTPKTDGSGIIVTNKCAAEDGSGIVAEGLAKPADKTGSKLKVTFLPSWIRWLPVGRADYWVLARDADYDTALVGTPDKEYLWLLARSPNISQQTYAKYRQIAQAQGYDLKEFKLTPHNSQTVNLIP